MPYYSARAYIGILLAALLALAAAWIFRESVSEPVILDLTTSAGFFGVFLLAVSVLALWHHSNAKKPVGLWNKVWSTAATVLFGLSLSLPIISIGHALADIIGFKTQLDYVELYAVKEDDVPSGSALSVEARATYRSVLLNAVTRTGAPYWFTLCAAKGYEPPVLADDSVVFHVVDGHQVPLEARLAYDDDRDPPRRDECSREELRVDLEVPQRERVCIDARYSLSGQPHSERSCWDLVHEINDDVFMLRDILRL
jgi:hypothetical protein